ncbi:homeobox-leucine zipper protein HAT22-like [Vigna radiata var. radiata]|uniref:Homeobox-leucine zipper protein HAT22-like n=1 Tax=Vigna radiata var. radiata TaxID=3916 RepID=A0A1S3TZ13_VIGRR|nr:homeobox-leucine zipper protein HAT22-like [Vigna radiata var. radiata]
MEDDEACITSLSLGLGMGSRVTKKEKQKLPCLDLTFQISPKGEQTIHVDKQRQQHLLHDDKAKGLLCLKHPSENNSPDSSNNNSSNGSSRKKLKLTKEQSATLEDIFKLHSTLNPAQKQALADQLNLKHRQVEVWFQNRRARTKLKQTEVDCEFLKKCCEKLTDENLRLKKELQELRAQKIGPKPLYIQLSKATTLSICSSCQKELKPNEGKKGGISDVVRNSSHKLQNSVGVKGI